MSPASAAIPITISTCTRDISVRTTGMDKDQPFLCEPRVSTARGRRRNGPLERSSAQDARLPAWSQGTGSFDLAAELRDRLAAAADAELLEDVMDVVLHRRQLDREPARDLLVREAGLEER